MARNTWTDEEINYLKANLDKSPKELAEFISRTENAIRIKKESLIFKPKKSTCKRCKKPYTKETRRQVNCKKCELIIAQERRIQQQVSKINAVYEEENKLIEKLQAQEYVCTGCGETKKGTEFHYMRDTQTLRKRCKACMSKKSKEARKKRISEGRDW